MTLDLEAALRAAREAEALACQASDGPWAWRQHDYWYDLESPTGECVLSDGSACGEYGPDIVPDGENGQFIAHARTAVPLLARHVREMAGEIERLRKERDAFADAYSGGKERG